MNKALFLDRDGTIIQMVYHPEHGIVDTARTPQEVSLVYGVLDLLKAAREKGYKLIVVSNQPGIGLGKMTRELFEQVTNRMKELLAAEGIQFDAEYYAFHHPFAEIEEYRTMADLRKPKPDMLLQAAREHDIELGESVMIGDGVNDVLAGDSAGCKTVLIANVLESEYLRILEENLHGAIPDMIVKKVQEATSILK